jgi:hypothetical protein
VLGLGFDVEDVLEWGSEVELDVEVDAELDVDVELDVEPPDLDAAALGLVGALVAGAARPAVGVAAFCFNGTSVLVLAAAFGLHPPLAGMSEPSGHFCFAAAAHAGAEKKSDAAATAANRLCMSLPFS